MLRPQHSPHIAFTTEIWRTENVNKSSTAPRMTRPKIFFAFVKSVVILRLHHISPHSTEANSREDGLAGS